MSEQRTENERADAERAPLALTENARVVLANRYLKKDESGRVVERPEALFERVASCVASVEGHYGANEREEACWQGRFYDLMASLRFLPNSPTLMNAGRTMGMLSACFVLPVPDSIDGIFDAVKYTALIQKAGGGTGFSFDRLRPTGDHISSSGGKTSGPISFWRVLSETTNAIQQGAFRRGANMGMMSVHHPDILKFLHAKQDLGAFTNYNISVKAPDGWMERLEAEPDSAHVVVNPRTGRQYLLGRDLDIWGYELADLTAVGTSPAGGNGGAMPEGDFWTKGQIWELIVRQAHATGEPGLVFIDRINRDNMTPQLGQIEATNPCGEQPLLPYEACNLGSINLSKFVRDEATEEGTLVAETTAVKALAKVDFAGLSETVAQAVRFLDDVIDVNDYQIEPIEEICRGNRKIGLGVMGFADALYMLDTPYSSEEALAVGRELMRFINERAHQASEELARQRGVFPNWQESRWNHERRRPQRNAAVTTVAPTGTLSIIADCSGGIEPLYSLAFTRNVLGGKRLQEINRVFAERARDLGIYSEGLIERVAESGSLAAIEEAPEALKRVFVCAQEIAPEWHVRMQGAFQEHCDAAISKTINFPHAATVEEVEAIYRQAYKLGCKGITVYRDGCRSSQPMSRTVRPAGGAQERDAGKTSGEVEATGQGKSAKAGQGSGTLVTMPALLEPVQLPEIMTCVRVRQLTPFGNMHVKITVDAKTERELEVFAQLGKGGDVANSDLEAICRLLSLLLRCGGSLDLALKQLDGIGSSLTIPSRDGRIMSLGDGLAKAISKYLAAKEIKGLRALLLGEVDLASRQGCGTLEQSQGASAGGVGSEVHSASESGPLAAFKIRCPSCADGLLTFAEGCVSCRKCGFSQC